MANSVFDEKGKRPDDTSLKAVLGRTASLWDDIRSRVAARWDRAVEEWNFSCKKAGWAFRIKHKKRTILHMIPRAKHFQVVFVLGDRAIEAAREVKLRATIMESIDSAKRYVEGTGFRFDVRTKKDVKTVLAEIKMAH